MRISEDGISLIKSFEGFEATAYQDSSGVWTVGYGSTRGVTATTTVTPAVATQWLTRDIDYTETVLNTLLTRLATQHQFDAMVSLAYNIGVGNFEHSTVLRKFNAGAFTAAADAFLMWNRAAGTVVEGLVRRRAAERQWFLTADLPHCATAAPACAPPARLGWVRRIVQTVFGTY